MLSFLKKVKGMTDKPAVLPAVVGAISKEEGSLNPEPD
jgi:hypothetical protein